MIEIIDKSKCSGCHGCKAICPKSCITMEVDYEGFWYPKVDKSKCINCDLCEKVCPIINIPQRRENKTIAYACKNKDYEVRMSSSSGGIFTLLCNEVIRRGGVVFGAAYNESFDVKHKYSETIDGCIEFRGSKYVQSEIGDTFKLAKEFLLKGRTVLFSGTPCQIAGIDAYLGKKYDNLILVDIACHGVPSPLVYRNYIDSIVGRNNSNIKKIDFRDKSTGWKNYSFRIEFDDIIFKEKGYDNIYMKGFLNDMYLRPSCYKCTSKKPITSADITLGDYWGVEYRHTEFDDDKGVSLILTHTSKGEMIIKSISSKMDIINTDYEYAINYNPSIVNFANYTSARKKFFKKFNGNNLESLVKKYSKVGISVKIKRKLLKSIRNMKVSKI